MATLLSSTVLGAINQVQQYGRKVVSVTTSATGLSDILKFLPSGSLSLHPVPFCTTPTAQEFGTLWGVKLWVDLYWIADIFFLSDDHGIVHSYPYSVPLSGATVNPASTGATTNQVIPSTMPETSSNCPCGIVRIDCDYHR